MQRSSFLTGWLPLVLVVFLVLIVGPALREGMFYDGLIYASIARNMAAGMGSFWLPHFTVTDDNVFHSHPPLAFWLESLPFYLTGDSIYGERIYELVVTALHLLLIGNLWRLLAPKETFFATVALPLLLWLFVPVVEWGAANNLLENTLSLCTTAAITCVFLFLQRNFAYPYLFAAATFILLAFGSKGVTSLFPLASVFLYYFCFKEHEKAISFKQMLLYSAWLNLNFWGLFGLILLLIPNAYIYLKDYMAVQVINSVENVKTVSSHWSILIFTVEHLSTMLIISILAGVGIYCRNSKLEFIPKISFEKSKIGWMLAVALSAVLPIMVSQKQSDFYALACYPFFAISGGLWLLPAFLYCQEYLVKKHFWKYISHINILLIAASLFVVFLHIGTTRSQEKAGIDDVALLAKKIPAGEVVGMCYDVRNDWTFSCYAMRYHYLELDVVPEHAHRYYILGKETGKFPENTQYEALPINFQTIRLYKLKE